MTERTLIMVNVPPAGIKTKIIILNVLGVTIQMKKAAIHFRMDIGKIFMTEKIIVEYETLKETGISGKRNDWL